MAVARPLVCSISGKLLLEERRLVEVLVGSARLCGAQQLSVLIDEDKVERPLRVSILTHLWGWDGDGLGWGWLDLVWLWWVWL